MSTSPQRDRADVRYQPQPTTVGDSDEASETIWSSRRAFLLNVGRTCNVSLGNLGMGLIVALSGVALLDLGEIYGSSISAISQMITTRCVGGLLGSLIGGKLYDKYNTQVISIVMMSLTCLTVLMIPISGYLALAHVMVFFEGFSLGAFGTGATVWIMKMWPQNSSPALQAFHLAFGVGCLLAPLVGRPFLSTPSNGSANWTIPSINVTSNDTDVAPIDLVESVNETAADDGHSKVHYAFAIASGFQLFLVSSMVVLYFIDGASFKTQRTNVADDAALDLQELTDSRRFSRIALTLLCAYGCVYVAIEVTTSQMLPTFAVKCDLHFSKPLASELVAAYFFCFAASRLAAALVTIKVSAFHVLVVSHVALVITATVLLGWGSSNAIALWAASALAGIAQGPLNAAMTAWVAAHINISNKMMSLVVVTAGIGSLSPPLLVGQFMDTSPNVFSYVCFGAVMLAVAIFIGTCIYLRKKPRKNAREDLVVKVADDSPDDGAPCV
ncbi:sodium-dependent glucose transporter 1A-like isoform X1 [Dermacentor silvarum]|uniref:sodium-dependent glucose transporter 1A-like isoform X1 n=1 Tax=Dermacentor silvarum TaxID=543639 RepID=UPI00189846EE|nr:sodium-dependent glucose transporter 1A-like isoform X1 [Dermacentor silvarum]